MGNRAYWVFVRLSETDEILAVDCTCPYSWGPHCKHMVAALLALHNSQRMPAPPADEGDSLEERLLALDRRELVGGKLKLQSA